MSQVRFAADTHFGHEWMAKHRGFQDVFYHDEHIVDMWNRTVHKRDVTFLIGDVTMEKANYGILSRLNGRIIVVGGNHDRPNHVRKMLEYVEDFTAMLQYKGCFLTHCPIHPSELDWRVMYNIHGHIHEKVITNALGEPDPRYICVSMEQIDYKPKSLGELIPGWDDPNFRNQQLKKRSELIKLRKLRENKE